MQTKRGPGFNHKAVADRFFAPSQMVFPSASNPLLCKNGSKRGHCCDVSKSASLPRTFTYNYFTGEFVHLYAQTLYSPTSLRLIRSKHILKSPHTVLETQEI